MCGRYTLTKSPAAELNRVGISDPPDIPARYNVAPGQQVPAVVNEPELNGRRILRSLEWGLIPPWMKEKDQNRRLINARSETIDSKPSFRGAARHRRCLIPGDGFYEWARRGSGPKQPYYFHLKNRRPFFFAGIWEIWDGPKGEAIDSCAIVTTAPNKVTGTVHNRMPVILEDDAALKWMDGSITRVSLLKELFQPYPDSETYCFPVGTRVNSVSNDDEQCIVPLP